MMTTDKPSRDNAHQASVVIRALSSITPVQAETIAQAVRRSGQAWNVETSHDYDGYLCISIEPNSYPDRRTFFISGTVQRLELSEMQGDDLFARAGFSDVDALVARLLELIAKQ